MESITSDQMKAYCKYRKLVGMIGTFNENSLGVFMNTTADYNPNEKHFTRVTKRTSGSYLVFISKSDYENLSVTDGELTRVKYEPEPDTNDYIY